MTLLKGVIPFEHRVWALTGTKDDHGNDPGKYLAPVSRKAITCYPMHWRNPHTDPISPDYVARVESDILLEVEDASLFSKLDLIVIFGNTFEVQGIPVNWGDGMPFAFTAYSRLVGGTVHARRVTSTGVLAG